MADSPEKRARAHDRYLLREGHLLGFVMGLLLPLWSRWAALAWGALLLVLWLWSIHREDKHLHGAEGCMARGGTWIGGSDVPRRHLRTRSGDLMAHHCHALNCKASVPPRLHMCAPHWRLVPRDLQRALYAAYRPGQERTMTPSAQYLRAAAACVRSVAEAEGQPPEEIDVEVSGYEDWATMLEDSDA